MRRIKDHIGGLHQGQEIVGPHARHRGDPPGHIGDRLCHARRHLARPIGHRAFDQQNFGFAIAAQNARNDRIQVRMVLDDALRTQIDALAAA